MNASTPDLMRLQAEAEHLARAGQLEAAEDRYARLLLLAPMHARALSFVAMRAFARSDLSKARALIDRAAEAVTDDALIQAQRASIALAQGDRDAARSAFEAALVIDPGFVPARLDLAALLETLGQSHAACEHYRQALAALPSPPPPALSTRVEQARKALHQEQLALEATIASHLSRATSVGTDDRARFDECLEIFLGKKRPMLPKPGMMYFPKLPPLTFFPNEMFDWVARVEAQHQAVTEEVIALLNQGDGGFIPYVQKSEAEAGRAFRDLNHNQDWGACFLYNQGQRVERHCEACPRTAALLDSLPLVRIGGRGPTAFFSRLKPGTHIVPHHGATNTRLIAHLPLIVPPDCVLRVGNDARTVEAGKVMVFDDTIEHEAWNRSNEERIVLIFDVWNPFLSAIERELVTHATEAMAEFHPEPLHRTDF